MGYMQVENLMKEYGKGEAAFMAVKGMSFQIQQGDFVAVVGESGSGKSTLLSMMGALNTPTKGRYVVDDIDVYFLSLDRRAKFRMEFLGLIFQSFHLIPYLNVMENVMLPLAIAKIKSREKTDMAREALKHVGLSGKENRLPSEISGGEQERVAIARAVVNNPTILLADEPTGNLDTKTSREIMDLFHKLNGEGITILMVTHNTECSKEARRILCVSDGLIREQVCLQNRRFCGTGTGFFDKESVQ
ncbi:MAG: ABC transporter ATP-binding protein [Deltaproteobacteria bacterium]|nr:ABC transporter ATP-binding protein [Deltaproteobacteria bacterium]